MKRPQILLSSPPHRRWWDVIDARTGSTTRHATYEQAAARRDELIERHALNNGQLSRSTRRTPRTPPAKK